MTLPRDIGVAAFDRLHDDPPAWREVIESIARPLGEGPIEQLEEGTALVARIGTARIVKLYPPFLRDHFDFECAMLARLHGRLSVPTPERIGTGERDGWPYIVMTQLAGTPLTEAWPAMDEPGRLVLLGEIGALAAQVHALPVGTIAELAPPWPAFIERQRSGCVERQRRTGLPAHLLDQVPRFIDGELPEGPTVLLTGEYTPFNLFATGGRLAAMFDFGDGLVGPREYDWLGPLCFLASGDADRCAAFMRGYGARLDDALRRQLMRLLLLHRYSNLPLQIAAEGWQGAATVEELAARVFP